MAIDRYIPKKYADQIQGYSVDADFDYNANRTRQLYTVYLKNGKTIYCYKVNEIRAKLKKELENNDRENLGGKSNGKR